MDKLTPTELQRAMANNPQFNWEPILTSLKESGHSISFLALLNGFESIKKGCLDQIKYANYLCQQIIGVSKESGDIDDLTSEPYSSRFPKWSNILKQSQVYIKQSEEIFNACVLLGDKCKIYHECALRHTVPETIIIAPVESDNSIREELTIKDDFNIPRLQANMIKYNMKYIGLLRQSDSQINTFVIQCNETKQLESFAQELELFAQELELVSLQQKALQLQQKELQSQEEEKQKQLQLNKKKEQHDKLKEKNKAKKVQEQANRKKIQEQERLKQQLNKLEADFNNWRNKAKTRATNVYNEIKGESTKQYNSARNWGEQKLNDYKNRIAQSFQTYQGEQSFLREIENCSNQLNNQYQNSANQGRIKPNVSKEWQNNMEKEYKEKKGNLGLNK